MNARPYIIIAGNICVGKTTTCQLLGELLACSVFYEKREILLKEYYSDPDKFAFLNQLTYSLQFLEQAADISKCKNAIIQDRSIYDTHNVFSRLQLQGNRISSLEFSLLERILRSADQLVRPSLLVLLDAPIDIVYKRMQIRGFKEELSVTPAYLAELRDLYLSWFKAFDICDKKLFQTDSIRPQQLAQDILKVADVKEAQSEH
jgi:deoxyadenosine/deoxycytidine kinase